MVPYKGGFTLNMHAISVGICVRFQYICSVFSIPKACFSLDASVSISTSKKTKENRLVMTFKDKAKWFSFEMSFVLAQPLCLWLCLCSCLCRCLRCTIHWIFLFNLLSRCLCLCLRLVKTRLNLLFLHSQITCAICISMFAWEFLVEIIGGKFPKK